MDAWLDNHASIATILKEGQDMYRTVKLNRHDVTLGEPQEKKPDGLHIHVLPEDEESDVWYKVSELLLDLYRTEQDKCDSCEICSSCDTVVENQELKKTIVELEKRLHTATDYVYSIVNPIHGDVLGLHFKYKHQAETARTPFIEQGICTLVVKHLATEPVPFSYTKKG